MHRDTGFNEPLLYCQGFDDSSYWLHFLRQVVSRYFWCELVLPFAMLVRVPQPAAGTSAAPKCPLAFAAFVIASYNGDDGSVVLPSGRDRRAITPLAKELFEISSMRILAVLDVYLCVYSVS
jgi:hypothetical protein